MYLNNSAYKRPRAGFTLVELLVSLTIAVGVLGAVFIIFNASNRALRQGYMTIRGFDLARGTFDIIESDLSTAFTQRELGDTAQFFGTPIGFTYVGTANPATGAGAANQPQIARVSYVVYFGNPLARGAGLQGSGRVIIQEIYDGYEGEESEAEGNPDRFTFGQPVITYSLLRYVEPGVGDLDSWPSINGLELWDYLSSTGEGTGDLIAAYLAEPILGQHPLVVGGQTTRLAYDYIRPGTPPVRTPPPTSEQKLLQDARKRELWLRMLAGDPTLPDIWQILGKEPRDFVVAENIYLPVNLAPLVPIFVDTKYSFFRYGVSHRSILLDGTIPSYDSTYEATTGERRLRDGQPDERWHLFWSSAYNLFYNPQLDANDARRLGVIATGQALTVRDAFGATFRADGEPIISTGIYDAAVVPGTPYDARLPEQVHVRFEYLLESPWGGISEFKREFDQIIDVPTGYTRKAPPTVAAF